MNDEARAESYARECARWALEQAGATAERVDRYARECAAWVMGQTLNAPRWFDMASPPADAYVGALRGGYADWDAQAYASAPAPALALLRGTRADRSGAPGEIEAPRAAQAAARPYGQRSEAPPPTPVLEPDPGCSAGYRPPFAAETVRR